VKKSRILTIASLFAVLLFLLSACDSTNESSSAAENQSQTTNESKNTDESSKTLDSSSNSPTSTEQNKESKQDSDQKDTNAETSQTTDSSQASAETNNSEIDTISDAVIHATLDMESEKEATTVDYQSKTMTQDGQKAGFEIVPAANHQDDFKEGFIKEVIDNGSNNVTLYEYTIDGDNQLSLIDTTKLGDKTYKSVVYLTPFGTQNIHLSTGEEACNYLKQHIDEGNNEDIAFDDMGGTLDKDKIGSYYTIKLVSKSMQANGGSGTVDIYKVYPDGTFMEKNIAQP